MDYTALAEIGCASFAGISTLFGWLWQRSESARDEAVKKHGEAIEKLGTDVAAHKLYCANHYVTQGELTKSIEGLDRTIQRLIQAVTDSSKETREMFTEMNRRIDAKQDRQH